MTTNNIERHSETTYLAVAEVATPIASQTFRDVTRFRDRRLVTTNKVREIAGEWVRQLERMTARDLQSETVVRIRIETKTVRTITLTDTITKTEAILTPKSDQYGNQRWKEVTDD